MTTHYRYKRLQGSVHKTCHGYRQLTMILQAGTVDEINALAKSRDTAVTSFIRELIEIALVELQEQGEIYRV